MKNINIIHPKRGNFWRIKKFCIFLLCWGVGTLFLLAQESKLISWWKFDEKSQEKVLDTVSQVKDEIEGNFKYVKGVSGSALKFDGFTTVVKRKAAESPKISGSFTVEAWVAVAAYPWNWCPIISQHKKEENGYYFGVGPQGHLGFKVKVGDKWNVCTSQQKIPHRKWTHVVGVYNQTKGVVLYLNGEKDGFLPLKEKMVLNSDVDLLIGMNREKRKPSHFHRSFGTLPSWYSFDGIMDEVKIYDKALSSDEIKAAYANFKHSASPDIPPRRLPSGPHGPNKFGAYYCKLKYYEEWDALWRVGPHPDVVVKFDKTDVRVVFWRGTRYSPVWVTENNLWMADQSVEAWNKEEGCFEHMQDRHCRYSHVRIIENTPARVVIHWRYAPVSVYNNLWKVEEKTGWGCWIDEYYYIYPDQSGIRKVMWRKGTLGKVRQFQESIPLCHPGQVQGDVINKDYVTVANLKGETQVYSFVQNPSKKENAFPENPLIQVHNLKSRNKPFIIFEPGSEMHYTQDMNIKALSQPGSCCHWPVGQVLSDGRTSQAADRATSFLGFPITYPPVHKGPDNTCWISSLYGMKNCSAQELVSLAKSWAKAPVLELKGQSYKNKGYDLSQRAYVLECKNPMDPPVLDGRINASSESPVENLCIKIKGWGSAPASISINGEELVEGEDFRLGYPRNLIDSSLVIWIKKKSTKPLNITINPK